MRLATSGSAWVVGAHGGTDALAPRPAIFASYSSGVSGAVAVAAAAAIAAFAVGRHGRGNGSLRGPFSVLGCPLEAANRALAVVLIVVGAVHFGAEVTAPFSRLAVVSTMLFCAATRKVDFFLLLTAVFHVPKHYSRILAGKSVVGGDALDALEWMRWRSLVEWATCSLVGGVVGSWLAKTAHRPLTTKLVAVRALSVGVVTGHVLLSCS